MVCSVAATSYAPPPKNTGIEISVKRGAKPADAADHSFVTVEVKNASKGSYWISRHREKEPDEIVRKATPKNYAYYFLFRGRSYHEIHFQYRWKGNWTGFGEEPHFLGEEWTELKPGASVSFSVAVANSLTPKIYGTWVNLYFSRDAEASNSFWLPSPPLLTKLNKPTQDNRGGG